MSILNLSGKVDSKTIAIYSVVNDAAKDLSIDYIVVGASARDLVLHYGYGAKIRRATADIDFGIQVPNWETFHTLKEKLVETGFAEDKLQHRMVSQGAIIDLVPFGDLENKEAKIAWPPNNEIEMNVLGFKEAKNNAIQVKIQDKPDITIPVVSPVGLSILKIICWSGRDADIKNKDAKDFLFLLKTYEEIPEIRDAIYELPDVMEEFDWDISLASAYKLGLDTKDITTERTKTYLNELQQNNITDRTIETLIEDTCDELDEYDRNKRIVDAYFKGFNS